MPCTECHSRDRQMSLLVIMLPLMLVNRDYHNARRSTSELDCMQNRLELYSAASLYLSVM